MLGVGHYMTISALQLGNDEMVFAGMHQDILIYRTKLQKTERLEMHGAWIGVCDDIQEYTSNTTVPLEKDDIILLFTDGITEAADENGEMFGGERLEELLQEYGDLPVNQIVDKIIACVKEFQNTTADDMTLVVARKVGVDRGVAVVVPPASSAPS